MNGILIINKPKGYTSHDVVNIVRKTINMKKVGHTGTLDPNATGVLPILIGTSTKISKYLIEHDKTYIATIKLGLKTNTGDSEGMIIEESKVEISKLNSDQITLVLNTFIGKQQQIPPIYSAIKVQGKKLYEYARSGQTVEITPRQIEIYDIELILNNLEDNEITFKVTCSKGTYIRVLCENIAKKLGTIGYMKDLQRTKVNEFDIKQAVQLEDISVEGIEDNLLNIERIFINKPKIILEDKELELFLNGVQLTYNLSEGVYRIYNKQRFIGLGIVKQKFLKRDIVI